MARLAARAASCLGRFGGAERAPVPGVRVRWLLRARAPTAGALTLRSWALAALCEVL